MAFFGANVYVGYIRADCAVGVLVEKKSSRYMFSHSHCCGFNMELCWACGEKLVSHTEIGAEKQCNSKMQLASQADMWHP